MVKRAKKLTASQEDYLEAIYDLVRDGGVARVRDIAGRVGVGMPSVTAALKGLAKRGLVNYDPYQVVTLSHRGASLAEEVHRRHGLLRRFLVEVLGLEGERAEENACRMEHALDATVLDRFEAFVDYIDRCPELGPQWLGDFRAFCASPRAAGPEGTGASECDEANPER